MLTLNGIGPSGAARLLVEVEDITRFPSRAHFASWNGTAPIDASSGDQVRHRLSRAGEGKTSMEAMRALKRRLSDIVYRTMVNDAIGPARTTAADATAPEKTGPGGHSGAATNSSAVDSNPGIDPSEKSLPGPVTSQTTTPLKTAS